MRVDPHDLHHDFPEFKERIHELKVGNHHFAKLFEEYEHVDKAVRHLEQLDTPTSDKHMEELKLKRVHVKDQLYHMLQGL
jgi:uncharacterized protein